MSVYVPDPALNDWVPMWNLGNNVPAAQPATRVGRSTAQACAVGVFTYIPFDRVLFDVEGLWSSGAPDRLVCKTPGKYIVTGHCRLQATAADSSVRIISLTKNAQEYARHTVYHTTAGSDDLSVAAVIDLLPGDYMRLGIWQNGAAPINAESYADWSPELSMALVGGMQGPAGTPRITTTSSIATAPANPQDGDLWICPVATQSGYMRWMFQYVASRNAWDFVGGPPLEYDYDAGVATSSGAYADLGGPSITIPRAGDYQVEFGCGMSPTALNTVANASMGIRRSSDNQVFTGVTMELYYTPAGGYYRAASRSFRAAAAATGEIWLAMYAVSNAQNVTFSSRWMKIIPQTVR